MLTLRCRVAELRIWIVACVLLFCGVVRADSMTTYSIDKIVFVPAPTITMQAGCNAPGWTVSSMTFTVDGVNYPATITGNQGSIAWNSAAATNPSEHYASASAQLYRDVGNPPVRQTKTMSTTAPTYSPVGADTGEGRQADFVITNLKLKSLKMNSPITLRRDDVTVVPAPQYTFNANGDPLTVNPTAYVRNTTPTFTFDLWNVTGNATMGFSMKMEAATPNTGDATISLYNTTTPEVFAPPATRTAQAPLLNKVAIYNHRIYNFNLYVKFTLANAWSAPLPKSPYYFQNTLYGVLATPTAPMVQPWTQVLDKACEWAKGTTDATIATTELTKGFYNNATYDPSRTGGWSTVLTATPDPNVFVETFYLGDFLNGNPDAAWHTDPMHGQCTDFADFLVCLSNAIGAKPLKARRVQGQFLTNPIVYAPTPIVSTAYQQRIFDFHQFGVDTTVFDAAVKWTGFITPANKTGPAVGSEYYNGTVDTTAVGTNWNLKAAFIPTIATHRP